MRKRTHEKIPMGARGKSSLLLPLQQFQYSGSFPSAEKKTVPSVCSYLIFRLFNICVHPEVRTARNSRDASNNRDAINIRDANNSTGNTRDSRDTSNIREVRTARKKQGRQQ
jgi:hypothetical protein